MDVVLDQDWEKATIVFQTFGWEKKDPLFMDQGDGRRRRNVKKEPENAEPLPMSHNHRAEFSRIKRMKIEEAQCSTEATAALMVKIVGASKRWQVGKLTLETCVNDQLWAMLADVIEFGQIERLEIEEAKCSTETTAAMMTKVVGASQTWHVGKLRLDENQNHMSNLRGETSAKLEVEEAQSTTVASAGIIVKILQASKRWQVGKLTLKTCANDQLWAMLADVIESGRIKRIEIEEAQCSTEATAAMMIKVVKASKTWQVGKLTLKTLVTDQHWAMLADVIEFGQFEKL